MQEVKDHDLLIELKTQVLNIRDDIKDLKSGTTERIQKLEADKADRKDVEELQNIINNKIEARVRKLEYKVSNYFITMTLYSIAVASMIGLLIYHILSQ
jgi:hypothetical protein